MIRRFMACVLLLATAALAQPSPFKIGVHYFPGWKDNQVGAAYALPWEKIKPYPEREPLLGWYQDGDPAVMAQQLAWMKQYGLDYVVFNWFWSRENTPVLSHAVNAFLQTPEKHGMQFAIMWANHTEYVFSKSQFEAMFRFWAQRYMFRADYLKVDGKPSVFVFSADTLNKNAAKIGMRTDELFAIAEQIFKSEGLAGLHVIGGTSAAQGNAFDYSAGNGYAGLSAYNFHGPAVKRFASGRQMSHSYDELDQGYRDQWEWLLKNAAGQYIVPMSSGWDKTPWGGSKDPLHDKSVSTPAEFEAHLRAAKRAMLSFPDKTKGMGVICCWNEYGEGSYVEPTKKWGFSYLEAVKRVFGK